jgi:hypothetical protein
MVRAEKAVGKREKGSEGLDSGEGPRTEKKTQMCQDAFRRCSSLENGGPSESCEGSTLLFTAVPACLGPGRKTHLVPRGKYIQVSICNWLQK